MPHRPVASQGHKLRQTLQVDLARGLGADDSLRPAPMVSMKAGEKGGPEGGKACTNIPLPQTHHPKVCLLT